MNKKYYHKQLAPIIDAINKTKQLNIPIVRDILSRVNILFEQHIDPKTKQEARDQLKYSTEDIYDFMNYPSVSRVKYYVFMYKDDIEKLHSLETCPISDFEEEDEDRFLASIETVLNWFISVLEA